MSKKEKSTTINLYEKKQEQDTINEILFYAEKITGKILTERQFNILKECYTEYKFDIKIIQYLIDYCTIKAKLSPEYTKKVAKNWFEMGIENVEQAKENTKKIENYKKKNDDKVQVVYDLCKAYYDTYKVLNAEYEKEQALKSSSNNEKEKNNHKENAIRLNGIINRNGFDFLKSIIDTFTE